MARSQISDTGGNGAGIAGVGGAGGNGGATSKGNEEKIKRLEEEMVALKKETERLGRENEKLRGVVGRYRERWEKLKEGARGRREGGVGLV